MCEFLSVVKKRERYYYLTASQIDSPLGQALQLRFPGNGDFLGHAAIRAYYDLVDGVGEDLEFTDFSSPTKFPAEIANKIKAGVFNGFQVYPLDLLSRECLMSIPAYAKWQKADAEWGKADAEWQEAYAEWRKADAEWQEALSHIFWDLFAIPANRSDAWELKGGL